MKSTHSNDATRNLDEGPSVNYVNEVVLKGLTSSGITLTEDCRITNHHGLSAADFVALLKRHGWSWPPHWYRRNLNYFQHHLGAAHLEQEVEAGRWIHIMVVPGKRKAYFRGSPLRRLKLHRKVRDWTLPPRDIELHSESGWLQPSSYAHLWRFLKEKVWAF